MAMCDLLVLASSSETFMRNPLFRVLASTVIVCSSSGMHTIHRAILIVDALCSS